MASRKLARLGRCLLIVLFVSSVAALISCSGSPDALERVLETGVLHVGMDASYPPFETVDGEGNLVGFDVDLARQLAARLGAAHGTQVRVEFVANLPYDGLYDALAAGRVDVVASALYVDPLRMDEVAYSTASFNAGQVLVVGGTLEDGSPADSIELFTR